MKITFVKPVVHQNGGSRVVAIYAEKLLAMGHDVTVVARAPEIPTIKSRIKTLLQGRVPTTPAASRTTFFDSLGTNFKEIYREGPFLPEDLPDADVVIATWWRTAFEVAVLPPEKGAKAYFVQHHEVHDGLPWDLSAGSYYLPLKKITIASWLVDVMAEKYGDHQVALVPNAVDTSHFATPRRERNSQPTVGFMFSATAFKGAKAACEAIDALRKSIPDLRVIAFGNSVPSTQAPLPAGAEFIHLPQQEKIPGIYASVDVWLCPSRSEGFGLPLLEAMACRTPVVATRTGAAGDLIQDGVNGYVVEIDDASAMAARLAEVLALSPGDWSAMSDAAHKCAHAYSWDDAARKFEAALEEIRIMRE